MLKNIMVVDDSEWMVTKMVKYLETLGHSVVGTAHNGDEAVDLFKHYRPDLLIMDLIMPQKDGFLAIEEIKRLCPQAKILIVTAVRSLSEYEIKKMGVQGIVKKPINFNNEQECKSFNEILDTIFNDRVEEQV